MYNDKVVYIELCYINLYDKSGNKVQQEGEVSFQVKMSDTMTNAGGDTYDLYYYDSSDNKITAVDSEVDGNTISFKSDRIGFFVIVNVNNSGNLLLSLLNRLMNLRKRLRGAVRIRQTILVNSLLHRQQLSP